MRIIEAFLLSLENSCRREMASSTVQTLDRFCLRPGCPTVHACRSVNQT